MVRIAAPKLALAVAAAAALALGGATLGACSGPVADGLYVNDPQQGTAECAADADCVAAASTCCACPSFALPATTGWGSSCDQLACGTSAPSCGEVRAACDHGACTLACVPLACDLPCAGGFAVDAAGCQTCACAVAPVTATCTRDDDCARVPADCCGCAKGGADTAIPAAEVAAYLAGQACGGAVCPGVDVCAPGAAPRCTGGSCVLAVGLAPELPPGACGRPDLPACPAGSRCTLNTDAAATAAGVGVCAP